MLLAAILAIAAATAPPAGKPAQAPVKPGSAVDICMRAAAAVAHTSVNDTDRNQCECADQQMHKLLHGSDYAMHEEMQTILASGANETTFNKRLSDYMLQHGLNQSDADTFFARLRAAEAKTQSICNDSPLLGPAIAPTQH